MEAKRLYCIELYRIALVLYQQFRPNIPGIPPGRVRKDADQDRPCTHESIASFPLRIAPQ